MTTLKQRTIAAFESVGVRWPADDSAAVPIGPAVIQCEAENTIGLVCVVSRDIPQMLQNAKLMVLLCVACGFPEPESDRWVARELIAAKNQARKSRKRVGGVWLDFSVDCPPTLIVLKATEDMPSGAAITVQHRTLQLQSGQRGRWQDGVIVAEDRALRSGVDRLDIVPAERRIITQEQPDGHTDPHCT